jgi:hypothetical protein
MTSLELNTAKAPGFIIAARRLRLSTNNLAFTGRYFINIDLIKMSKKWSFMQIKYGISFGKSLKQKIPQVLRDF